MHEQQHRQRIGKRIRIYHQYVDHREKGGHTRDTLDLTRRF